jgi:hypothetical protein
MRKSPVCFRHREHQKLQYFEKPFSSQFLQLGVQSTIFDIIAAETTAAKYQIFQPNTTIRIFSPLQIPREQRIGACKNSSAFHIKNKSLSIHSRVKKISSIN